MDVLSFLIPLAIFLSFLLILGVSLIIHSIHCLLHNDDVLIHRIKLKYEEISEYIDLSYCILTSSKVVSC